MNISVSHLSGRAVKAVSDFLFPPVCAACGGMTGSHDAFCASCWSEVRFIERPYCEVLGTPFPHDMGDGVISAPAIADPPPFDRLRSAVIYDGPARAIVGKLKYRDRLELAKMMADAMMRVAGDHIRAADFIIPVPLHASRFFMRQFNQSAELGRMLSGACAVPLSTGGLRRIRRTNRQVGLRQKQREDNVRGAFALSEEARLTFAGRRIVLVDDVYTTGATVSACSRALRKAKPQDITVVTFAMALPETI